MPIPSGFKVRGMAVAAQKVPVTPRVQKIIDMLAGLPKDELITTIDITLRLSLSMNGNFTNHPALWPYKAKVDNKLFWGNAKTIIKLNQQLAEPEETQTENR